MFQQKKQNVMEEDKNKANIEVVTFLGVGTEFRGKVVFQGTLRIDGVVEGEVDGTDTLILGDTGFIKGVCKIGKMVVSGKVRGEVYASEKVVLKKNADVHAKIITPSLVIEEGATFNGTCKMGREFPDEKNEYQHSDTPIVKL